MAGDVVELDAWVLSCRAFARRIEYAMLHALYERESVPAIRFHFEATDRNGPIQELLSQLAGGALTGHCQITADNFVERKLPWYMRVQFGA
jgi:predicted enzyme involved in methoxymalonyl-ACP biosynthesis